MSRDCQLYNNDAAIKNEKQQKRSGKLLHKVVADSTNKHKQLRKFIHSSNKIT